VRRLFWLAFGLAAGALSAITLTRFTRRQIERAKPASIAREARGGLLDLSRLVTESIDEGRRAMDARERELRASHDVPGGPGADRPAATLPRHGRAPDP
jgi:hypothetical protein